MMADVGDRKVLPVTSSKNPAPAMPPLREVIERHNLWADKKLGQHFLLDLNVTRRIARAALPLDQGSVIEVGPGPGGLTRALLELGAQRLIAIEKDHRCRSALEELRASCGDRLRLIEADALALDLAQLGPEPRRIVANLPYNIATPLLINWLRSLRANPGYLDLMVLMFQSEVAGRLVAAPNSKSYGRLSVITQWLCRAEVLFQLPGRAFTPEPKVASAVVRLAPHRLANHPGPGSSPAFEDIEKVTAAAFGQRRKMLRQSLKSLVEDPVALLRQAGLDATRRAETLSVAEFCTLADAFAGQSSNRTNGQNG